MFRFKKDQKVSTMAGMKVGGQPGDNPPLLIASMFHNKDRIVTDRKGNFDRAKAVELIKTQEALSASTGIPAMVAMVANSAEEAKIYIDFYRETTKMPFGIDMWVAEKRAEATEYVARLGLQDQFLYNSITPWDKDIKGQVRKLKDLGIKHVWMHRAFGGSSVSQAAATWGREHGIRVIDGGCPLMFGPTADAGHKVMRLVCTLTGKVPWRVS